MADKIVGNDFELRAKREGPKGVEYREVRNNARLERQKKSRHLNLY